MLSPYAYPPIDVCEDLALPDIPAVQDCVNYTQLRSEVCGVIIRPTGALAPLTWYRLSEWYDEDKIDNTDPAVAHYIVGRGSFLPTEKTVASLAGGRVEVNRERTQRLVLNVSNMDAGHLELCRKLQANKRDFTFYVVTVGGISGGLNVQRIIGGTYGLQPVFSDAIFAFQEGKESRESVQIILDIVFHDFPQMPI